MSKLFSTLTTDNLEKNEAIVGGGYTPLDTNVYPAVVKIMYVGKAASGANNITVIADLNGREYRETIYITNKAGQNFYEKNGKKFSLPGFDVINDMCLFALEQGLSEVDFEEKVVKVYSKDAKAEVPTPVQAIAGVAGKQVLLAIARETHDQTALVNGAYEPTGETVDKNFIKHVFHPETGMLIAEYQRKMKEPVFRDAWIDANAGKVYNKAKGTAGAKTGVASAQAAAPKPAKSLFSE